MARRTELRGIKQTLKTNSMNWDIRTLGLEHLPTPLKFWMYLYDRYELYFGVTQSAGVKTYTDYVKFLNQPLSKDHEYLFIGQIDVVESADGKTYIYFSVDNNCYGFDFGVGTIEDLLNKATVDGVKIRLKTIKTN